MPKISFYKKITQTTGGVEMDLTDMVTDIKIGTYKNSVEKVRAATTKKERTDLKRKLLPYFTGSGTFTTRSNEGLVEHNGRIIIDTVDFEDVNEVKSRVGCDPYVEYCITSCGGKGLAIVFKIDPERHRQSFEAIREYLRSEYQIEVDDVKDISRPRFVTYDPDLIENPEARVFEVRTAEIIARDPGNAPTVYDVERIKHIVDNNMSKAIDGQKHYYLLRDANLMGGFIAGGMISEAEGRDWMQTCVRKYLNPAAWAAHFKTIDDGIKKGGQRPITAEVAEEHDRYHQQHFENIKQVFGVAADKNRAGIKWTEDDIKLIGKNYGVDPGKVKEIFRQVYAENKAEHGLDDAPLIVKVEQFLSKHYNFYFNEITQVRELRPVGTNGPLQKVNYDSIWRTLEKTGFKFPLDKLKSLLRSDYVPTYNPFRDYFESLPVWDGKDHIDMLASHVKTTQDDFWRQQFKKAMVRMIHCALDSYVNRIVVVLVSELQEPGKSFFIRFLNPFGIEYYTESPIGPGKDTEFAFAENFIYNLEELSSLTNTDVNRLKAIISKSSIKERKPYQTDAEAHPRRCTFWGSTNKLEFLTDTSNTRWLCFTVEAINWDYSSTININDVYAQAYALYKDPNFVYALTTDEAEKRDFINKEFEITDHEKELIMLNFRRCEREASSAEFLSNSEIFTAISNSVPGQKLKQNFISKSMVQLGFVRDTRKVNGHTVRGFWVIRSQEVGVKDTAAGLTLEEKMAKAKQTDIFADENEPPF